MIALGFLVILGAFFGYYFGSGKFYEQRQKDIAFKDATNCNLHLNSCKVSFDKEKEVVMDISNRPMESKKELIYQVRTVGFDDKDMLVSIVGVNMNMGLFEKKLIKNDNNFYEAHLALPSCINGLMKWKISVISKKEKLGANFIVDIE